MQGELCNPNPSIKSYPECHQFYCRNQQSHPGAQDPPTTNYRIRRSRSEGGSTINHQLPTINYQLPTINRRSRQAQSDPHVGDFDEACGGDQTHVLYKIAA